MKFNLKSVLVLLLMAAMVPANATIARLTALGMDETDNEGSYYIQDDRNIFLNVANIHNYGDSVILEWGGSGQVVSPSLGLDTEDGPKAKGGFLRKSGDNVYGVYLGNESNTSSLLRTLATGANAAQAALPVGQGGADTDGTLSGSDNQLDLFYGGKSSFGDWGVNLVYASSSNEGTNRNNDTAHAVRLGLKNEGWDAFANISTGNKAERVTTTAAGENFHQFEGSLGLHLGGGAKVGETGRVYGFVKTFSWEQTDSLGTTAGTLLGPFTDGRGQAGTVEGSFMTYAVGYGSVVKSGKGTWFSNIEYRHKEVELKFTTQAEAKNTYVPLTVGYEFDAASWLTLRGSVRHNIIGTMENNNYGSLNILASNVATGEFGADTGGTKQTMANSTDISAGASFNLGSLRIDGFIGTTAGTRGGAAEADEGVLALDNLLTRVAMVYNF